MNEQFEHRLSAIEYELSQIAESDYLEELKEKFSGDYGKDVVVNIIPSKDISFKTRSLLSSILDRLELNHQDRLDLEKYIVYGGGDNIEYLKQTLAVWVEWKDKILNILQDAPEEFDSLIEIFNYIEQHIQDSNIKLEEINNNILYLNEEVNKKLNIEDSPFEKGTSNNSAVLKGGGNTTVLKGWYYSSIYKESNSIITVYLSSKQKICAVDEPLKTVAQTPDNTLPNLANILGVGTIVSLINDAKYDNRFKIIGGSNGEVRLQTIDNSNIPFNVIKAETINDPEDYSIYCVSKPDTGMFDMGQGSVAIGYNNKATNGKSTAFGYNNHAYGKFSFVEGRDNEAGYASHAEGRTTHATGDQSHSEGRNTWATGDASHAEGSSSGAAGAYSHAEGSTTHAYGEGSHSEGLGTKANTKASHAEGDNTSATGIASHAEGVKTKTLKDAAHAEGAETSAEEWATHAEGYATRAVGYGSHTEGDHTIANNPYEHASGRFNKSETGVDSSKKTRYSIGIGTSDTDRKNAFEVKQNGDVYITGIGGFTGANSDSSKSVQEVINELVNKLNEITIND